MPASFDLIITTDPQRRTAELELRDAHGQLAYNHVDFNAISVSHLQGLFDLRNYLRSYVETGKEQASVAEIGVCIAEEVLGEKIFRKLWESNAQRTLRIQLPGATEEEDSLAAALARVPWEIARPAPDKHTLGERNLLVRVVHDMAAPASQPLDLPADECLRVLFVFAEAPGSRPLAARREREELLQLFEREIYPHRRVEADFLTHGVTRERLESQIEDRGGYHIVHWSGHGHLNLLELTKAGGGRDLLTGQELLDLFGGYIPRLFFLSACHSGDILRIEDWNDFLAAAQGKEPDAKESPVGDTKVIEVEEQTGYTGTAHALLQGGVPSVVAMRYAVGDEYARELTVEVYRHLLADKKPKTAAEALTMARQALLDSGHPLRTRFAACDHATPVLYGEEHPGLTLKEGRSPCLDTRDPRLHIIPELTIAEHRHFVGRTRELAGLGAGFIGSSRGAEVQPVALITGLGGMGKTALTAEALSLWEKRFQWVLLYQAKPNRLEFDVVMLDIHTKLNAELGLYYERVKKNPGDAIYRRAEADFTGPIRQEYLIRNLLRALKDEPILLVLDNFETNLKPQPEPGNTGEPAYACQDSAWDACLSLLAVELAGTPSRVLITSRRPLAALADDRCHRVLLGPLPPAEAALYLREHPVLGAMLFGDDEGEKALARRLLNASRFHPLLMDRLARLAAAPSLRPQLLQALDTLEKSKDFSHLPALFAAGPDDAKELAYLNDALTTSIDQLIRDASPDARRLLWIIAVANEPVVPGMLESVWDGESFELQQLRQIKQMLDMLPVLPPEIQDKLNKISPEFRAKLDALPPAPPAQPDPTPLLHHLKSVGLATDERTGPEDENPELTCHELVRERIRAWMQAHPQDCAELTENAIRLAYAERLEVAFNDLQHENMTAAFQAGSSALVYYIQAKAYDQLGSFAGSVVTSTVNPHLLENLLPHLEAAAAAAPEGKPRRSCLCYLADALRHSGHPDASLPFYEQAANQARIAAEGKDENIRQAWDDLAVINSNWANALLAVGNLDAARQRHLESANAEKQAEKPVIKIIGNELEALRIDIMQGRVEEALPQVEARLAKVENWWQQHHTGQPTPEVPDIEELARTYICALDIVKDAKIVLKDWKSALQRVDVVLEVKRTLKRPAEDIAQSRMNRAIILRCLHRFTEAKSELEICLEIFENDPVKKEIVLSSLASLFANQGDFIQAIIQERRSLAICELLPNPRDRAGSHHNLAIYLGRYGDSSALVESSRHQLAALIYRIVSKLGQDFQMSRLKYAFDFRQAHAAGVTLTVPSVAELIADPVFHPLAEWLRQRQVDIDELQADIDNILEQVKQAALQMSETEEPIP